MNDQSKDQRGDPGPNSQRDSSGDSRKDSRRETYADDLDGEDLYGLGLGNGKTGEFTAAMNRLEKAVSEVVTEATDQLSGRATNLLDDTSRRLEAELRIRKASDDDAEIGQ